MKTIPTRIDVDVYEAAKVTGDIMSRSAAQQASHWMRVGRELELSQTLRHTDIARVLAHTADYDSLDVEGQALVRASWTERMTEVRNGLNFASEFTEQDRTWTEVDEDGNLVTVNPKA